MKISDQPIHSLTSANESPPQCIIQEDDPTTTRRMMMNDDDITLNQEDDEQAFQQQHDNDPRSSSSSSFKIHTLGDFKQALLQHIRQECPAVVSPPHHHQFRSDLKDEGEEEDEDEKASSSCRCPTPYLFFSEEKIRGIYLFGSQTYQCKKKVEKRNQDEKEEHEEERVLRVLSNDRKSELRYLASSDFDVLLVCDDLYSTDSSLGSYSSEKQFKWETGLSLDFVEGNETNFLEFDISFYNTCYFISYMNYHQPVFIQSVTNKYWEDVFVVFEDDKMKYFRSTWCDWNMSIPRLKVAFSTELDYCMEKAHRFWNMTIGETDELKYNDNYNRYTLNRTTEELKKTSKKNIAHGLRKLRFAYQYLENGKIIHLQEWNALAQEVFDKTKYYYEWMQFEDTYKPIYEEKKLQFQTVCENIIGVAERLLTNYDDNVSLAFLSFLNSYCSKDNQEGRKRVHEFMNSTQALTQEDQETVQHSVLYLFKDVHSLTKLFNIDVSHFDPSCETTTPQQVAQCTTFQLSLNLNMFYLNYDRKISNEVLQCDGAIIELMSSPQQFRLVCAPRWFIPDIRDQPEIAISCQSLSCFKLPYGDKVSLFFHKNAWTIACSEIERANWKRWVLLDNVPSNSVNSWRDDFWNIWKNLKMELPPENMQDKTFHFVWNKHQGISLVSVRVNQTCQIISHSEMVSLCEKLNWNVLEPMKELEFSTLSSGKLFWKQALEKSASLDPTIYEGLIFHHSGSANHATNVPILEVKTPIHYLMPKLNIVNHFYSGTEILNSSVIENPDDSLVRSDVNDMALFQAAVMHSQELNPKIQQVIQQRNPLFLNVYNQWVEHLAQYGMERPMMTDHMDTKQYLKEKIIADILKIEPLDHEMVLDIIYEM